MPYAVSSWNEEDFNENYEIEVASTESWAKRLAC